MNRIIYLLISVVVTAPVASAQYKRDDYAPKYDREECNPWSPDNEVLYLVDWFYWDAPYDYYYEHIAYIDDKTFYLHDAAQIVFRKDAQGRMYITEYNAPSKFAVLDSKSTERQQILISDYYTYKSRPKTYSDNPYWHDDPFWTLRIQYAFDLVDKNGKTIRKDFPYKETYAVANNVKFNFDLSKYACDFDIYIAIFGSDYIFDDAFADFKVSDNVKSVTIYLGGYMCEVGHNAFSVFENVDEVNICPMLSWHVNKHHYDFTCLLGLSCNVYDDSFSKNVYDNTMLKSSVNDDMLDEWNALNRQGTNFYTYFRNHTSGVENIDIDVDKKNVVVATDGNEIVVSGASPHSLCELYNTAGTRIDSVNTDSDGRAVMKVDARGVYIVRAENKSFKIML